MRNIIRETIRNRVGAWCKKQTSLSDLTHPHDPVNWALCVGMFVRVRVWERGGGRQNSQEQAELKYYILPQPLLYGDQQHALCYIKWMNWMSTRTTVCVSVVRVCLCVYTSLCGTPLSTEYLEENLDFFNDIFSKPARLSLEKKSSV